MSLTLRLSTDPRDGGLVRSTDDHPGLLIITLESGAVGFGITSSIEPMTLKPDFKTPNGAAAVEMDAADCSTTKLDTDDVFDALDDVPSMNRVGLLAQKVAADMLGAALSEREFQMARNVIDFLESVWEAASRCADRLGVSLTGDDS